MALILLALNFHIQSCHPPLGPPFPRSPALSAVPLCRTKSPASTPHVIVLCPLLPPSSPSLSLLLSLSLVLSPPLPLFLSLAHSSVNPSSSSSSDLSSSRLPISLQHDLGHPLAHAIPLHPRDALPFYIGFSNPYGFENVAVTFKRTRRRVAPLSAACHIAFGAMQQMTVITMSFDSRSSSR